MALSQLVSEFERNITPNGSNGHHETKVADFVALTLFSAEKLEELIKPNGHSQTGIGNSTVRHSRRREQRARYAGWRRR